MRIAIFSDIHGNNYALEAILKDIEKQNVDEIYYLGDCIAIGPNPKAALDLIKDNNIKMVLGNHERYFVEGLDRFNLTPRELGHQEWNQAQLNEKDRLFLSQQPLQIEKNFLGHHFKFQHFPFDEENFDFYPAQVFEVSDLETFFKSDATYNFFGHHHFKQHLSHNNKHYINVGSSGCVSSGTSHYFLVDISQEEVEVVQKDVSFDFEKFKADMIQCTNPEKHFLAKVFFKIEI